MWKTDEQDARAAANRLADAGLLEEIEPNEWWMNGLLRAYAADRLCADPYGERAARLVHAAYWPRWLDDFDPHSTEDWQQLSARRPEFEAAVGWLLENWRQNPELTTRLVLTVVQAFPASIFACDVDWLRADLAIAQERQRTAESEAERQIGWPRWIGCSPKHRAQTHSPRRRLILPPVELAGRAGRDAIFPTGEPMIHHQFTHLTDEIRARVDALLAQMTLEEKVGQMNQLVPHWAGTDLDAQIRAGQIGSLFGITNPAEINRFQRIAVKESRLGIPLIIGNDVIHGYRTVFPIPLAEACAWDPDLQERASRVAADEAVACGTEWIFAPMVDICRDPRWGRIAEGAGEDPFLGRAMARAHVRGFQSMGLVGGRKIVACPKHYVAYGAAEAGRDYNTVDLSERTLRDLYLPPFKAAFDEGAGTVMSAFNEIGGLPATANPFTLQRVLREEWGLADLLVVSDYNAIGELIAHGIAADLKEAACKAVLSGVDMDMMSQAYIQHLPALVREGAVPEAVIDAAVRRILGLKFALGLFDAPYVDEALSEQVILRPEHRALALEMARKSMVLLKNDGLLPLRLSPASRIALIGPLADDHAAPLGCWAWMGHPDDVESVLDGFRDLLSADALSGAQIEHVRGCAVWRDPFEEVARAEAAARQADVVVLVLGENAAMSGEARSRAHLDLPGQQRDLLERVVATGTPTVVVLMSGRPLVLTPWIERVSAVLQAWHGGIRAGRAVAEILLGHVNPSGKLSVTFPRALGQVPIYYAHKNTGRPPQGAGTLQFEDPFWSKYIDESNEPLFPFGYGLSYTTYNYDNLQIETPVVEMGGTLRVSATVSNTGTVAGEEVVQLYVRDLVGSVTRPVKELKGFQRIVLQPGESGSVRFELPVTELGFHGPDNRYIVEPGMFQVWIAPNSAEGLDGQFELRE